GRGGSADGLGAGRRGAHPRHDRPGADPAPAARQCGCAGRPAGAAGAAGDATRARTEPPAARKLGAGWTACRGIRSARGAQGRAAGPEHAAGAGPAGGACGSARPGKGVPQMAGLSPQLSLTSPLRHSRRAKPQAACLALLVLTTGCATTPTVADPEA